MGRVVAVFALVLLVRGTPAFANAYCEVDYHGYASFGTTLKDAFDNQVFSDTGAFDGLGFPADSGECALLGATAVSDYGWAACSQFESGVALDVVGDVYFDGSYVNSYSAPSSCSSGYGLNAYITLGSGSSLNPGDHIDQGSYRLIYQTDGNIVVYNGSTAIWAGNCWSACSNWGSAGVATMQTDGNFVVYNSNSSAVWASATDGNSGAFLALRSDGEAVVYSTSGQWLWSSDRGHP